MSVLWAPGAAVFTTAGKPSSRAAATASSTVVGDAFRDEREAVGEQELARRVRVEPHVLGVLERALDDGLCRRPVDPVQLRDDALRLAQPLGSLGGAAERAGSRLRIREGGQAPRALAQALGNSLRGHHHREHGLLRVRLLDRKVDRLRDLVGRRAHCGDEEDDDGVDVRVGEQVGEGGAVGRGRGSSEHVDRVRDARLGGQQLA